MFMLSAYNTGQNPNFNVGNIFFLISNFCCVLNVVYFFLGNSLASELESSMNKRTG